MDDDRIALFELTLESDHVRVVEETHYQLVPGDRISAEDLAVYRLRPR
jgi:hypothetical protein